MTWLTTKAMFLLLLYDALVMLKGFPGLYRLVERTRVAERPYLATTAEEVLKAVNSACGWYPKRALCLQRSATTVYLLRRYGLPASLVIGATRLPFQAHAWVELDGKVLNDRPGIQKTYGVILRS